MCAPVKEIEKRLKRIIKIMDELLVITLIMNITFIIVVIVIKIMDELLVSEDIITVIFVIIIS